MKKLITGVVLCLMAVAALADTNINGRWLDYFDEGDSFRTDGKVVVTTRKPNEKAGAYLKTGFWRWDFSDKTLVFKIRLSDWSKASIVTLRVGNGLKFERSAYIDIRFRLINPAPNEWIEVSVPPSAWVIDNNNIELSKIDSILLTVADSGDSRITAELAEMRTVPLIAIRGAVSITFDDGLTDTMAGFSVMNQFGMPGSAFVDPVVLGTAGYMSLQEVRSLSKNRWDISGHRIGNLTSLTPDELRSHIEVVNDFLVSNTFNGYNLYAFPNGAQNAMVNAELSKKFSYLFNINGMNNTLVVPTSINRQSIDKFTTVDMVKKWVDSAKKGEWVILTFHSFSDDLVNDEDWTLSNFTEIVRYLNEQDIPVKTLTDQLGTRLKKDL